MKSKYDLRFHKILTDEITDHVTSNITNGSNGFQFDLTLFRIIEIPFLKTPIITNTITNKNKNSKLSYEKNQRMPLLEEEISNSV